MTSTNQTLSVAETILSQLGGAGRLSAMLGAHTFTGSESALTFKFKARASNGANCIRVTLDPSDTYTVEFLSVRGASVKSKGSTSDVYADSLRAVIESATGLYLSLGTLRAS